MRRYVVSWRRPNWSVFGRVVFAATPEALAAFVRAQAGDEAALVVEHERDAMPGEYERWLALRLWTEDWTRLARTAEARTLL